MEKNNDAILLSRMLRLDEEIPMTSEDIKYVINEDVNYCWANLTRAVAILLAKQTPYDKILEFIDNYSEDAFDDLLLDQKSYIKSMTRRDLQIRRKKLEGEDK